MDDAERERWRGKVDAELDQLKREMQNRESEHKALDAREHLLELKVETIATKIGLYASLGAMIGGGLISLIVSFFHK